MSGEQSKSRGAGGPVAFYFILILFAGQLASCNQINSSPEARAKAGFWDFVCAGFWPVCMGYDAAYDYMAQRLKRDLPNIPPTQ